MPSKFAALLAGSVLSCVAATQVHAQPPRAHSTDVHPEAQVAWAGACAALNGLDIEQAADSPGRIVDAVAVSGREANGPQTFIFAKRGGTQGNPTPHLKTFPDHCRVEGYVTPNVKFLMMLPAPEAYNQRFMLAACEAWCGKIFEETLVPGLHDGFATITNDGGHYSRAPFDGIWAHRDMEARENFAYRANHVSAQVGKAIAAAFYGSAPRYSYIAGFSKGGNAGLFAAERYPEDFDGVFVKAPVVNYNPKNAAHFPWLALAVYPDGKTPVIYDDKLPLIQNAVLAACDDLDGLKDGVIDDPHACTFDPVTLACTAGQDEKDNTCLSPAQVTAVRKIYAKPVNAHGEVYFEYPVDRGSESDWSRSILPHRGGEPSFAYTGAATGLRYMATPENPGPGYDWTTFDYVAEKAKIEAMSRVLDPDDVDLSAFKARGGKMIIVHGWADAMISAQMTVDWLEKVQAAMGGPEAVGQFLQLYAVPGINHGASGPGPFDFDALGPLMNWVEKGKAPTQLLLKDEPGAKTARARPAYPWPAHARYSGKGDPELATSFVRVAK